MTRSDAAQAEWEIWIDRGGTFTDVIGRSPDDVRERAAPINPDFPFGLGGLRSGHAELLGGESVSQTL